MNVKENILLLHPEQLLTAVYLATDFNTVFIGNSYIQLKRVVGNAIAKHGIYIEQLRDDFDYLVTRYPDWFVYHPTAKAIFMYHNGYPKIPSQTAYYNQFLATLPENVIELLINVIQTYFENKSKKGK